MYSVARPLSVLLVLILGACDTFEQFPSVRVDGVSLETDGPDDGIPATIPLVLRNSSTGAVRANACATVEQRVEERWTADGLSDRPCDQAPIVVEPDSSYLEYVDVDYLPNGTYRFVQETSAGTVASSSLRIDR